MADGTTQTPTVDGQTLLRELGLLERGPLVPSRLNLGRGRTAMPVSAEYVRDLALEDLIELGSAESGIQAIPVKELRNNHHAIAKLLAQGAKTGEVSVILGIGVSRISILQSDPAFIELLAYYQDLSTEQFTRHAADLAQMLHGLGADSIATLHERLLDRPDSFAVKDLADIVRLTADRTGHGPTATVQTNHVHSLDETTLARIRSSGANASSSAEIDPQDRARLLGNAVRATELHPSGEIIEGEFSTSEGPGLRREGGEAPDGEVAGGDPLPSVDQLPGDWT